MGDVRLDYTFRLNGLSNLGDDWTSSMVFVGTFVSVVVGNSVDASDSFNAFSCIAVSWLSSDVDKGLGIGRGSRVVAGACFVCTGGAGELVDGGVDAGFATFEELTKINKRENKRSKKGEEWGGRSGEVWR